MVGNCCYEAGNWKSLNVEVPLYARSIKNSVKKAAVNTMALDFAVSISIAYLSSEHLNSKNQSRFLRLRLDR